MPHCTRKMLAWHNSIYISQVWPDALTLALSRWEREQT